MAPADLAAAMEQAMGAFARASELLARESLCNDLEPMEPLSSQGLSSSTGKGRAASSASPAQRKPARPKADPVPENLPTLAELAQQPPILDLVETERLKLEQCLANAPALKKKPAQFKGTPAPARPPPPKPIVAGAAAAAARRAVAAMPTSALLVANAADPDPVDATDVDAAEGAVAGARAYGVGGHYDGFEPTSAHDSPLSRTAAAAGSPIRLAAQRVSETLAAARARAEQEREVAAAAASERAVLEAARTLHFQAEGKRRLALAAAAKRGAQAREEAQRRDEEAHREAAKREDAERVEHAAHETAQRLARKAAEARQRAADARRAEQEAADAAARESCERGEALVRNARDRIARRGAVERALQLEIAERVASEARYRSDLDEYNKAIAEDARRLARERLQRRLAGLPPPSPHAPPPPPPPPAHLLPGVAAPSSLSPRAHAAHNAHLAAAAGSTSARTAAESAQRQLLPQLAPSRRRTASAGRRAQPAVAQRGAARHGASSVPPWLGSSNQRYQHQQQLQQQGARLSAAETTHLCEDDDAFGSSVVVVDGGGGGLYADADGDNDGDGGGGSGGYANLFGGGGVRVSVNHDGRGGGGYAAARAHKPPPAHGRRQPQQPTAASRRLEARLSVEPSASSPLRRGRQVGVEGSDRLLVDEADGSVRRARGRGAAADDGADEPYDYNDDGAHGRRSGYGRYGSSRDEASSAESDEDRPPREPADDDDRYDGLTAWYAAEAAAERELDAGADAVRPAAVSASGVGYARRPRGVSPTDGRADAHAAPSSYAALATLKGKAAKRPVWKRDPVPLTLMADASTRPLPQGAPSRR